MRSIAIAVALVGCATTEHGSVKPSFEICKLGTFDQELVVAPDFRIDRHGDDSYESDDVVRAGLTRDSERVKTVATCPGHRRLGTFRMTLRRIEVGSSRSVIGKVGMWVALLPTLGLSSIYPLSESRWITVELDAAAMVGDVAIWSGELTWHVKHLGFGATVGSTGQAITELMDRAQRTAIEELGAAVRTERRAE